MKLLDKGEHLMAQPCFPREKYCKMLFGLFTKYCCKNTNEKNERNTYCFLFDQFGQDLLIFIGTGLANHGLILKHELM